MNKKLKLSELGRHSPDEFKHIDKIPVVVVLDNIRSGHNVGSVFRTSDAYKISTIYLCGITAQPPQKDIQKTAIGATDTVNWSYHKDSVQLVADLKKEGFTIVSVEQATDTIGINDLKELSEKKIALVLGNEVKGVDQKIIDISDHCLELPQFGTKHSLNVSVCAGIIIWEVQKLFLKDS